MKIRLFFYEWASASGKINADQVSLDQKTGLDQVWKNREKRQRLCNDGYCFEKL